MSAPVKSCRAFVALAVPALAQARLADIQSQLRLLLPPGTASWPRLENLHLTLRFLGNVANDRCEELASVLSAIARGYAPLDLTATGLGCFPNVGRPHVVWVGIRESQGHLRRLHAEVHSVTAPFTSELPEDRFVGHVTLARLKKLERGAVARLADFLRHNLNQPFGQWRAARLLLLRSDLSAHGSRYTLLAELPFSATCTGTD